MSKKKVIKKEPPGFDYEKPYFDEGVIVAGIDEAGRGCLAGPVVAGAVILNRDFVNSAGINDSKKLSFEKREEFYEIIKENSISMGVGIVDNETIDKINILEATLMAMNKAIQNLKPVPGLLLIDGNYFRDCGIRYKTIIGGDSKCFSISAASIIAKVSRDRWMIDTANAMYPDYGFIKNKGYGTKQHLEAIQRSGLSPIHRRTFLRKYLNQQGILF